MKSPRSKTNLMPRALDPVDANGDTALHYAVRRGNLAVVKVLLGKNDVDKVNKAGESALFLAVRKNQDALAAAVFTAAALFVFGGVA